MIKRLSRCVREYKRASILTPLFVSLTKPGDQSELAVFERDGLWVTTKRVPRTFDLPEGVSTRIDLSWDPVAP